MVRLLATRYWRQQEIARFDLLADGFGAASMSHPAGSQIEPHWSPDWLHTLACGNLCTCKAVDD